MTSAPKPALDRQNRTAAVGTGSLRTKLLWSHLWVAAIGLLMLLVTLLVSVWMRGHSQRLATVRRPTVQNSMLVQIGVQQSLASLRGWMVLGEPKFKSERRQAWAGKIAPAMAQLESLSAHWTDPANGRRLVDLRVALIKLKEAQWWVEDVAQTPGNEPARVMFNGDIRKIHRNLAAAITPLVAIGQGRSAEDQHPSLQEALHALQVDYLRCHWALGAYVDQRAPSDRSIFDAAIKAAYGHVRAITAECEFLDREQHELSAARPAPRPNATAAPFAAIRPSQAF